MAKSGALAVVRVSERIAEIRGLKVLLDSDLALLYGVATKALNQAVKRNRERFPSDFSFVLTAGEFESLRSQFVTSNVGRGGRRHRPRVFTEHGALMAASVLSSDRAVQISLFVVRAFIRLRDAVRAHVELRTKLDELERTVGKHDKDLDRLFGTMRALLTAPLKPRRQIGFRPAALESREKGTAVSRSGRALKHPSARRRNLRT